jgi:hypothetical protein
MPSLIGRLKGKGFDFKPLRNPMIGGRKGGK